MMENPSGEFEKDVIECLYHLKKAKKFACGNPEVQKEIDNSINKCLDWIYETKLEEEKDTLR